MMARGNHNRIPIKITRFTSARKLGWAGRYSSSRPERKVCLEGQLNSNLADSCRPGTRHKAET
jgi:hypothetical protein